MQTQLLKLAILFIDFFSEILYWAIFAHILMSWISRRKTIFTVWLNQIVTPLLIPFKWARIGMIDFAPMAALIAIQLLSDWLLKFLATFL
jgi:uncharacterized protein YggT (Ycf19 family)